MTVANYSFPTVVENMRERATVQNSVTALESIHGQMMGTSHDGTRYEAFTDPWVDTAINIW